MNTPDAWQNLAAAARRLPDTREVSAPYGFAGRVAAQALAAEARAFSFFEQFSLRLSLRAMGVACALAVLATGASYPTLMRIFSDNLPAAALVAAPAPSAEAVEAPAAAAGAETPAAAPASDDPVAELVDIIS